MGQSENLLFLGVPILKHIRVYSVDPDQMLHLVASELDLHCIIFQNRFLVLEGLIIFFHCCSQRQLMDVQIMVETVLLEYNYISTVLQLSYLLKIYTVKQTNYFLRKLVSDGM